MAAPRAIQPARRRVAQAGVSVRRSALLPALAWPGACSADGIATWLDSFGICPPFWPCTLILGAVTAWWQPPRPGQGCRAHVTGLACKASQSGKVHGGLVVALAASFVAS